MGELQTAARFARCMEKLEGVDAQDLSDLQDLCESSVFDIERLIRRYGGVFPRSGGRRRVLLKELTQYIACAIIDYGVVEDGSEPNGLSPKPDGSDDNESED